MQVISGNSYNFIQEVERSVIKVCSQFKSVIMKYFLSIILLFCMLNTYGQTKHPAFDALGRGDLNALGLQLDERVEFCMNGKISYLDKADVVKALKSFLEANPPKSCTPLHKGASKGNESNYLIAHFSSTNGRNFRVFLYAEENSNGRQIQELKIDSQ